MQLELDTDTWDIRLDKTGNISVLNDGESSLLAQRIKTRLQTFQGELYLDRSAGVPYFAEVFKKNPDIQRVRALLLTMISGTPGVSKVKSLDVSMSSKTRTFYVKFIVLSEDGEVVRGAI